MKNKGFTLVELITTFALTSALIVILTNIVLIIKDVYVKYNVKTELLIKQGTFNQVVNSKIENGKLVSNSSCGNNCYQFVLADATYELKIENDKIMFGDYIYEKVSGSTIGDMIVTTSNGYLNIQIPITNKLFEDDDFGLNLVYIE